MSMTLLSPKQLAKQLGISPQAITAWCRAGWLDGYAEKIGHAWVIRMDPLTLAGVPEFAYRYCGLARPGAQPGGAPPSRRGRPRGSRNKNPYPKGVKRKPSRADL